MENNSAPLGQKKSPAGEEKEVAGKVGDSMQPTALMTMSNRAFLGSTESYLAMKTDLAEFWLALGRQGTAEPIGYARYVRCADADQTIVDVITGTFELSELISADSPRPHPIVSLSGVLWTRRAALEADATIHFFLLAAGLNPEYVLQSSRGSSHREA
ncbi:hypothetical protein [Janthinobacterium sp. MDT1-19]|uniref:hypothetical protein n=1 Tax=Janthinobacterium sp. MDT1-19 TaxID=1259339 RepID=UPI003F23BAB4